MACKTDFRFSKTKRVIFITLIQVSRFGKPPVVSFMDVFVYWSAAHFKSLVVVIALVLGKLL